MAGITGAALDWFSSYLSNRKCFVSVGEFNSETTQTNHGIPQGSILGPVLFTLYMLPLGHIIRRHNISFHSYADDTQLYLSFKPSDTNKLASLQSCLQDITGLWMSLNFLKLNADKTEVLIIGPDHISNQVQPLLGPLTPNVKSATRNLGVILDSNFSLEKYVKKVVKSCFYQLRNISKIRSVLSFGNTEKIIHALISSRLDYCNSLYTCLNNRAAEQVQILYSSELCS